MKAKTLGRLLLRSTEPEKLLAKEVNNRISNLCEVRFQTLPSDPKFKISITQFKALVEEVQLWTKSAMTKAGMDKKYIGTVNDAFDISMTIGTNGVCHKPKAEIKVVATQKVDDKITVPADAIKNAQKVLKEVDDK